MAVAAPEVEKRQPSKRRGGKAAVLPPSPPATDTMSGRAPPVFSRATQRHDIANLVLLPILGVLTVAGLTGYVDPMQTTYAFTAYTALDLLWVGLEPAAVPSKASLILLHHVFTLALLAIPLKYPQLAIYTCWDGLVEVNTCLLIARRAIPRYYKFFNRLYWLTFYPIRVVLFPALLPWFYLEMRPYAWYEQAVVVGAQAFLCIFNAWFLIASFQRKR